MPTEISRVTRSKAEAQAAYDNLSRWYDVLAGRSEKKYRDIGLQKLNAKPNECILELGCGTGHCLVSLAQSVGSAGRIWGLDLSPKMLAITQTRVEKAGVSGWVKLQAGDAVNLPFPSNYFDAVFSSFTLELFDTPEIPQVLTQSYDCLKPGGRICVVNMAKREKDNLAVRLYELAHEKIPSYADCRPILVKPVLEETGFIITHSTSLTMWGLPVDIVLAHKEG